MTMVRYNIQTGANGSVVIPTTPFADGAEIEVVVLGHETGLSLDDDWQPDPEATRQFREWHKAFHVIDLTLLFNNDSLQICKDNGNIGKQYGV